MIDTNLLKCVLSCPFSHCYRFLPKQISFFFSLHLSSFILNLHNLPEKLVMRNIVEKKRRAFLYLVITIITYFKMKKRTSKNFLYRRDLSAHIRGSVCQHQRFSIIYCRKCASNIVLSVVNGLTIAGHQYMEYQCSF